MVRVSETNGIDADTEKRKWQTEGKGNCVVALLKVSASAYLCNVRIAAANMQRASTANTRKSRQCRGHACMYFLLAKTRDN
jgi:hypothetical protein